MSNRKFRNLLLAGCASVAIGVAGAASAQEREAVDFDIPAQPLGAALTQFAQQSKVEILFSSQLARDQRAPAVRGEMAPGEALAMLLAQSGLSYRATPTGSFVIEAAQDPQSGSAAGDGADGTVDTLVVTAQKREEDIQDVPIAISAFTQEDLTRSQVAGGPDLITQIPNFTFTKTNFSSYSIQIRGIGTQAISATTDPAVAVAFNNTPFIRNRFFEQEFYDLERLEVLRGPQGTLYGRNATAGVVNIISQKPKFSYEAKASADVANYSTTRLEGMLNFPLVEDKVALRLAGAWTKRDGYATNEMTGKQIDGRDLWSTRISLRFEPNDWISANLIWEHFEEDDDRLRSGKQLCKKHVVTEVGGVPFTSDIGGAFSPNLYISQGCERVSLYSSEAFQTPYGHALPYFGALSTVGVPVDGSKDPYRSAFQSRDLRVIESSVEPDYRAKADVAELQVSIDLSDTLTLNSETAYSTDMLFSLQDYNRFTTNGGNFVYGPSNQRDGLVSADKVFCDPQLGCSDRLLLVDISTDVASQFSQEFRLGSDFDGPFNFNLGANYLRYDTEAKYYVFVNSLTMFAAHGGLFTLKLSPWEPGVSDNNDCMLDPRTANLAPVGDVGRPADPAMAYGIGPCVYIDPNPIGSLNDQGRNYFLSRNPYKLISYAVFGETYYELADNLKLTAGLRWTVDRKTAPQIPSWLLAMGAVGPYPTALTLFQEWREPTGRLAIDWKPNLAFTDETLVYASYAHGYKAGGANPPPPVFATYGGIEMVGREIIPDTFDAEFVDAFEIGSKNTLLDGALTLNLAGFYYDYKNYQVSEIRNRSAVNSNYDAEVWGLEVESDWRVNEALRLGFKGGWQETRIADGEKAIDLMDRTAGNPDWIVIRPFPTIPSNCIIPVAVALAGGTIEVGSGKGSFAGECIDAYYLGNDPITSRPYDPSITDYTTATSSQGAGGPLGPAYANYHGFDPSTAPNGGRGFDKQLGGNELPNAPNFTATITADYTTPLAGDWLMNLHGDLHWQSDSWWRVFNDHEYNRLDEFYVINMAAIFTNEDAGWKVMAYVKNVLDEDNITGAFLNSDDTMLTTNVFLTEPRLYGVRVTKDWSGGGGWLLGGGARGGEPYPLQVELAAGANRFSGDAELYAPDWLDTYTSPNFVFPLDTQERDLDWGDTRSVKVTYAPADGWRVSGTYLYGKTNAHHVGSPPDEDIPTRTIEFCFIPGFCPPLTPQTLYLYPKAIQGRSGVKDHEEHIIADFMVGKDIGIGAWGEDAESVLSVGLRYATFKSTSAVSMYGVPYSQIAPNDTKYASQYLTSLDSRREFEGIGPSLSWAASHPLLGDDDTGRVGLDWAVTGGVLFGERTTTSREKRFGRHEAIPTFAARTVVTLYDDVVLRTRTEDVTAPNLSLSVGLSYAIDRVKISTGYSYDRFFDVIDGGHRDAQSYDRTIDGPYLKLSVGFGG